LEGFVFNDTIYRGTQGGPALSPEAADSGQIQDRHEAADSGQLQVTVTVASSTLKSQQRCPDYHDYTHDDDSDRSCSNKHQQGGASEPGLRLAESTKIMP
jgi:hypothetical protein